jgi:putative oxidoreductase
MAFAILFLRVLVMLVFATSGWRDLTQTAERAKSLGLSLGMTKLVGTVELLAGLGVGFGVLPHLSSAGLMIIMLGAMFKKAVVWKSGFWGKDSQGWHYDLLFFAMNLLVFASAGGHWTIGHAVKHLTGFRWLQNL